MVTTEGVRQGGLGRSPYHSKAWLWLRRKVLGRVGLAVHHTIPFQGLAMVTTEGVRQGMAWPFTIPYHSKAWIWLRRKVLGRVRAWPFTIPFQGLAMVTTEGVRQGGLGRSPYHSKAWLWLRRKVLGRVGLAVHHTIPRPGYGYDGRC